MLNFNFFKPSKLLISLILILGLVIYFFYQPYIQHLKLVYEYAHIFNQPKAKILLVHNNGFGERETTQRLLIAAQRLNIRIEVANGKEPEDDVQAAKIREHIKSIIKAYRPDFVLVLEDVLGPYAGAPNYLTLTRGGYNRYIQFTENGEPSLANKNLYRYDALLPSLLEYDLIKNAYKSRGKEFFGFTWMPSAYKSYYQSTTTKKLFYSGGHLWDDTRNSKKYLELFTKLDQAGYFAVCGVKANWLHTPSSYIGQIPFDGKTVLEKVHAAGATLLLHHQEHIIGAAPTSRVFEGAAANVIMISDRHPFIEQVFGDNVLYIDTEQDAQGIFAQIDAHMRWIQENPEAAQIKAANCQAIANAQFSLEQQLAKLLQMHAQFTEHKKLLLNNIAKK